MLLHPKTPSSLASFKSRQVLPFWYRLTQVVLENRPLNGCSSSSSNRSLRRHINCTVLQFLHPTCIHTCPLLLCSLLLSDWFLPVEHHATVVLHVAMALYLSVTSRSTTKTSRRIKQDYGMEAFFNYTVSYGNSGIYKSKAISHWKFVPNSVFRKFRHARHIERHNVLLT